MKSLEELKKLRDELKYSIDLRDPIDIQFKIQVSMGTCGIANGARETLSQFVKDAAQNKLNSVAVTQTDCVGSCLHEPIVQITNVGGHTTVYCGVDTNKAKEIFESHIINNKVLSEYTLENRVK